MMKKLLATGAATLALTANPAAAFTNESFESGLAGWASVGNVTVTSVLNFFDNVSYHATVTPIQGNYMAKLTTDGTAPEVLWQSTATAPTTQPLTLWYRFLTQDYSPWNDTLTLQYKKLGDTSITTIDILNVAKNDPDSGWKSFLLPAGTIFLKAQLSNYGDGGVASYGLLDIAPVPEPESFAMLLAGLGVMGAIARRRRQKVSAA